MAFVHHQHPVAEFLDFLHLMRAQNDGFPFIP
jgi:hypothetical protein